MAQRRSSDRPISSGRASAFGVVLALLLLGALVPVFRSGLRVNVGEEAARTITSPRDITFESELLTQKRQNDAAAAVPDVLTFDPKVKTEQLAKLDAVITRIAQVRSDSSLSGTGRRDALQHIPDSGGISARSIDTLLELTDDRWLAVAREARAAVSDVLSQSLDAAAAAAAKDTLDQRISGNLDAGEALVAAELARPLIAPTLVVDQARTEKAREEAKAAVAPALVSLTRGQVIVEQGQRVDPNAMEALRAVGLLEGGFDWRRSLATALIAMAGAAALAGYLFVFQPRAIAGWRQLAMLAAATALPLFFARIYFSLVLPDESRHFLAYVIPLAAAPILLAALLDTQVAITVGTVMAGMAAVAAVLLPDQSLVARVNALDALRLMLVYGFGSTAGVFAIHRVERLSRYLAAGAAVAIVVITLLLATWFVDGNRSARDLAWIAGAGGLNGLTSALLAAGAFVTVGFLFGVTTRVQLMELAQLTSPLLRRLQEEAPGTFHHSIIVGNLAERAADLIGADPLLARVGCYYHDIGKIMKPGYYIENQLGGENPHDSLDPHTSAGHIADHVTNGLELARRYRLPARVQAFIPEHHGTRLVAYFYRKAAAANPDVDAAPFTYPGPRPRSRETAIVMLADSVEALVRASSDRSPEKIDELVDETISERLAEGQLDECDLTLRELRTVAESFKLTLRGVYHPRIQYPEPTEAERRRGRRRFLVPQSGERRPLPAPPSRRARVLPPADLPPAELPPRPSRRR